MPSPSIVCAIDLTTPAGAVAIAANLARRLDVRLVLAHAVVDVLRPRARNEAERRLIRASNLAAAEEMLRALAVESGAEAELRCAVTEPVAWLVRLADDEEAELIVVAPRDLHPARKLVSGSVSSALGRRASCPVVAVPGSVVRDAAARGVR